MKEAEKIRKLVTRSAAGVLFALLLVFNLQLGQATPINSSLSLSDLAAGPFTVAPAGTCHATLGADCQCKGACSAGIFRCHCG
jgi:hypothetical protein